MRLRHLAAALALILATGAALAQGAVTTPQGDVSAGTLAIVSALAGGAGAFLWRVWREIRSLLETQAQQHRDEMGRQATAHTSALAKVETGMDRLGDRMEAGSREIRDSLRELSGSLSKPPKPKPSRRVAL